MVFGDLYWFMLAVWIALLSIAFIKQAKTVKITASTMGLILALMLLEEDHIFAFLFFLVNVICLIDGAKQK